MTDTLVSIVIVSILAIGRISSCTCVVVAQVHEVRVSFLRERSEQIVVFMRYAELLGDVLHLSWDANALARVSAANAFFRPPVSVVQLYEKWVGGINRFHASHRH